MYKFIYVFDKKTADSLIAQGFHIVKSDEEKRYMCLRTLQRKR